MAVTDRPINQAYFFVQILSEITFCHHVDLDAKVFHKRMSSQDNRLIVLSSPEYWIDWFHWIKKTAQADGIWDYVNPDMELDEAQQKPIPVANPAGHDTQDGPSAWAMMQYSHDRKTFDDQKTALAKLNPKIFEIVDKSYRDHVRADSPYQDLKALKTHEPLTEEARIQALRSSTIDYSTDPKAANWRTGFKCTYECVYADTYGFNLSETQGAAPLRDFVGAAGGVNSRWAGFFCAMLGMHKWSDFGYTLPKLIDDLRTYTNSGSLGGRADRERAEHNALKFDSHMTETR